MSDLNRLRPAETVAQVDHLESDLVAKACLVDHYGERKESAEERSTRMNQPAI